MSVIVLDGPEKAGKTTFARLLRELDPRIQYRHWGPIRHHSEYMVPLLEDVRAPYPVIWDRSWACERVYGELLDRESVLRDDPFLGEWYYGRVAAFNGVRIVLAPLPTVLTARRLEAPGSGDLPVDPFWERLGFVQYADQWGWSVFTDAPESTARAVIDMAWRKLAGSRHLDMDHADTVRFGPRGYVGPWNAPVVFVGEAMNPNDPVMLPFSSEFTARYGRVLGSDALRCGWTNAADADPEWLRNRTVVACGQKALTWCYQNKLEAHAVPHPSFLYRWGSARGQIPEVEETIRRLALGVQVS